MTDERAYDWRLFTDWCAATGVDHDDALPGDLDNFLEFVDGNPRTTERRRRNVLRTMSRRGSGPRFAPLVKPELYEGHGWVDVARALEQLPITRFPVGLRGRRDGWLLVLLGTLGFSRRQALAIHQEDVELYPALRIAGQTVPRAADPGECPACAVTRWLRVLGPASLGNRVEVREILDPFSYEDVHDCGRGLDGAWRVAPVMTPSVDQHGWLGNSKPLSLVAVSTILAMRQRPMELVTHYSVRQEATGRFKDASMQDLADAYDDVDERLQALLAKTASMLEETEAIAERVGMSD